MLLLSSGCGQAGGELDRLPFVAREGRLQRSTADGYEDLFLSDDPAYASHSDSDGPNSYVGYLLDLKDHYRPVPLVIGELGVPSSWGITHYPRDRYDLWHNVTSPEDNFRVIGFAAASRALETAECDGVVATLSLGGEVVSAGPFLWEESDTVDPWVEYEKGSFEVFAEARGRSPRRGRGDDDRGPVRRC